MNKIKFFPEAADEYRHSKEWYNIQDENLGDLFEKEIERGLNFIINFPTFWAKYYRATRRFILRKFPYSIIYKFSEKEGVVIVAVMHHKQKPKYWSKRIK